ncbi:hypothetical protein CEXT_388741 [Caerostris extrusa]|uniref:Uncharacterized protein n=1 Tax=Caerostris extrusa TaxID=172846 RepID=A0AAV4YEH7_CAEEX|nr:hypothetical protein CEXT_388741 [Caerostris extrusa]
MAESWTNDNILKVELRIIVKLHQPIQSKQKFSTAEILNTHKKTPANWVEKLTLKSQPKHSKSRKENNADHPPKHRKQKSVHPKPVQLRTPSIETCTNFSRKKLHRPPCGQVLKVFQIGYGSLPKQELSLFA